MNKITKIIIGAIVLILLVWGGVKLFGTKNEKTSEPIKIGAILPFTGSSSITGEISKNGLNLAADEVNKIGGIKGRSVEILYEDSQTKTETGVSAFQKLRNINGIKFVFTSVSGVALAISPLANENKIVQMDVVAAAPAYSTPNDFTFRTGVSSYYFADKMSNLLRGKNLNDIALLYVNTDYGVGYKNVFADKFTSAGGNILGIESFNQNSTDFKTQIIKIKNLKPSALVLISLQKETPFLLRQMDQLSFYIPIYTDVYVAELQDNLSIPVAEHMIYLKPSIADEIKNSRVKEFNNNYKVKYGNNPDFIAAQAYDGFYLLVQAMKKCDDPEDTICVKNNLTEIKKFQGIIGDSIEFDVNGDITGRSFELKTIKNGQFVKYEE